MRLEKHGRTLLVAVSALDSPAKREGHDFVFIVCSERCGDDLAAALAAELQSASKIGDEGG